MISLTRRAALAATLAASMIHRRAAAAAAPYVLPPLGYAPNALDRAIDAETMSLHHDKHHAAYVNNLNTALKDHPEFMGLKLTDLLARLDTVPEAVRTVVHNNAGGHANHSMFWQVMAPGGGEPDAALTAAIARDLGGVESMKAAFNKAGLGIFGSGWVFVTVDAAGRLAIVTRPNQDTPLMQGGRVLLGNDVWEHAYYLRYHNVRADYLKAWWGVVNWPEVSARYARAKAGTLEV